MSTLKVGTIQDHATGTTAINIDSAGRVTKPALPCWNVSTDTADDQNSTTNSWTDLNRFFTGKDCDFLNGGCTLTSNTYITIPVTGFYQVNATIRSDLVGTGYVWLMISKNNSTVPSTSGPSDIWNNPNSAYHTQTMTGLMQLSANDTLRIKYFSNSDANWHVNPSSFFSGFLVG